MTEKEEVAPAAGTGSLPPPPSYEGKVRKSKGKKGGGWEKAFALVAVMCILGYAWVASSHLPGLIKKHDNNQPK
jgi:hypothetical protein